MEDRSEPFPDKAALKITLAGSLVEQKNSAPSFAKFMKKNENETETLLSDLITAIDHASNDSRITNLILDLDYFSTGGISKLEELGQALIRFKSSGKPVIAIGDSYNQEQYFLASFADEIHLNPMGSVLIEGYSRYSNYFKDALSKLKVNVNIFRVGTYKDAIEPFSRNSMSSVSKEHTSIWLNELWHAFTDRIESSRGLPAGSINEYSNNLGRTLFEYKGNAAELALSVGLVDKLSSKKDSMNRLTSVLGITNDGDYQSIEFSRYIKNIKQKFQPSTVTNDIDKVALITASGIIEIGDQPNGKIGSESMSQLIKQASDNKNIKAVVIRINSPGGGAFASELIRQDIIDLKELGKPVIISMGSVAASGGYWIATGATEIWSTPTTITGSIGVFGIVPTFEDTFKNIGVESDGVSTSTLSSIYDISRPMSANAKQVVQSGVNSTYDKFLSIVAEARNSSVEKIDLIAQGRVWTGRKALELGLVDKLGGLNEAIQAAAKHAELEKYEFIELTRPLSLQEKILNQISDVKIEYQEEFLTKFTGIPGLFVGIEDIYKKLEFIEAFSDPRSIYLSCFECIN
jgi:protease-4